MTTRPTILVPLRVLEGESIPEGVPELLARCNVVLLGYHVVPDQTATDQARNQFGDRASNRLEQFRSIFEAAGATVETKLVFTREAQTTIDRTIYEHDCLAVLVPGATGPPEDVLVPIRGTVGIDRMVRLVSGLFGGADVAVTLYHVLGSDETEADAQTLLDGVASRLVEAGLEAETIYQRIEAEEPPVEAIVDLSEDFDVVVIGESDPSVVTFVFGMRADQVAERFLGPVLVVQRERPTEDGSDLPP